MFRKMRRFNQQITDAECIEILKNTKRGVLSLLGEDGYPYGIPIDHWYCEEDGRIRLVEDEDTARMICTELIKKFTDDQDYLEKELKNSLPRVQCLELIPEHMTGKLVNES